MKKFIIKNFYQVGIFIILFSVASFALDKWRGKNIPKNNIPAVSYTSLTTELFNINQLSSDKLVVVYFWATWCGPCKVTTPSVKQLAKHYPVVSIAMASGENIQLTRFTNDANMTFPVINDNNQAIARSWGVKVTPSILFIKNGKILGFTSGVSAYPGLLARAWWLDNL